MRCRWLGFVTAAAMAAVVSASVARAEDRKDTAEEKDAIFKRIESFVDTFHKGDAKALAAFWTADGDYTDPRGKTLNGREAIEKGFKEFFSEHKGLKLNIDSQSLRFVTPDVAIEDGVTAVIPPDGTPPNHARYTIVYVKKNGKWYMSSVRDAAYVAPSNQDNLRPIEWLIGEWTSESENGETSHVSFDWSPTQNFINSSITTTVKQFAIGGAVQWIGWDPIAKQIRAWTFEDSGGFGEGLWKQDGNKWTIKASAVLRDGKKLTATNIITKVDADTMTFESNNRTDNGKEIPDIKPIKFKRAK